MQLRSGSGVRSRAATGESARGDEPPRGLAPLEPHALAYDKPLCASLDGFTLHACAWRSRIAPKPPEATPASEPETPKRAGGYRPWAELLARTFGVDVLACPKCQGRMKLLAMLTDPVQVARYLAAVGEATEVPRRSDNRGPPYWKSRVLRRLALGEDGDGCTGGREAEPA